MSRSEILCRFQEIFRDVFDDDELIITEDTIPEDIEDWDSIGHVYLVVGIEETFGVKLGEKMAQVEGVREMIDILLPMLIKSEE